MNLSTKQYVLAWLESLRPKTLLLALASVMLGSSLAFHVGQFQSRIALLTLCTACLLQIISNLANDYGDVSKGTDTETRIGPKRGMQKGLINAKQMRIMLGVITLLTMFSGVSLLVLSCQSFVDFIVFLLMGALAIIAAITYTIGRRAYGYLGLGDLSVLLFFGWLGVFGCYYLQTHHLEWSVFLPATASGLFAVAVLNINNLRDIDNDSLMGKRTLVVRMGKRYAQYYHAILLIVAMLLFGLFVGLKIQSDWGWLFLLTIPLVYSHIRSVLKNQTAQQMRPLLGSMVKLALIVNLFFSLALVISA